MIVAKNKVKKIFRGIDYWLHKSTCQICGGHFHNGGYYGVAVCFGCHHNATHDTKIRTAREINDQ